MSDKIISITDEVKPKNIMSEAESTAAQEEARAVLDRMDQEKEDLRAQEIRIDGTNKVRFRGYPYVFEASGEKIIVAIDVFKSGYECKVCDGNRKVDIKCICETETDRPGYKYSSVMLEAFDHLEDGRKSREVIKCPECHGDYLAARKRITCTACNGTGALILMPKEAEKLPHHGTVVSIGALAQKLMFEADWNYRIGDRVLWGEFSGQFIPTKAGLLLKIMDYNQVISKIEGADDMNSFDFLMEEKN